MSILAQVYYFAFGKLFGLKLKELRRMNLRSSKSINGYHDLTAVMSCNADNARQTSLLNEAHHHLLNAAFALWREGDVC